MPSQPASLNAGCRALFGHTFMHSPQRIQRARNRFSSSAAGGRISRSCGSAARPVLARNRGIAAAPADQAGQHFATLEIRDLDGCRTGSRRKEAKSNPAFRAIGHAVHAQMAFGFAPRRAGNGIVAALAMKQATVAILAMGGVLFEAQNGPARSQAQQRTERTQCAAPEAGDAQVEREDRDEDRAKQESLAEMSLLEAEEGGRQRRVTVGGREQCAQRVVTRRKNREGERSHGERDGIENPYQRATQKSRRQQSEKQIVLEGLPRFVTVGSDESKAGFLLRSKIANQMVQCAERADPATEEATEK